MTQTVITGEPSWGFIILLAILVAFAVACVMSARARAVGLVLLALAAVGLAFGLFYARQSASHNVVLHGEPGVHLLDAQAEVQRVHAEARRAHAEHLAEIVKNQRLAAQMQDAVVQRSPDDTSLETYPDGMQIRQEPQSRRRTIIRPADANLQAHVNGGGWSESHSTQTHVKAWILGAPLLALIVAFLALRARKPQQHGSGLGWVIGGGLALMVLGFAFMGSDRVEFRTASPTPVPSLSMPADSATLSAGAHDQLADVQGELERVHGEMMNNLQVAQPESIESIWTRLAGPRIKLDPAVTAEARELREHKQELAAAARTILAASTPGADPFTQGWLMNAAKTILDAAQKSESHGEATAVAETIAASAQAEALEAHSHEHGASEHEGAAATPDKPRPEWIDDPPQMVGNTRRIVVSSDPYVTVEECRAALREELRNVVHARVTELAEAANGGHYAPVPALESMGISVEYILSELCTEPEYVETVHTSVGDMKRIHVLIEFNDAQDRFLADRWKAFARVQSVEMVGGLAGVVVAGLAFVYGLLKVDTWTRGYYTKRLFLGVPAAIIAVFFIAALFMA